jgi:hypothetical protein
MPFSRDYIHQGSEEYLIIVKDDISLGIEEVLKRKFDVLEGALQSPQ